MSDPNYPADPFSKVPPPPAQPPMPMQPPGSGPVGKVRGTGLCIFLFIITLGIYGYFWWGMVHAEMRRHTNTGIGAGVAVIVAIVIAPVTAFLTCYEIQSMYEARGQQPRIRTTTGLWYFPGNFIVVGPIVWFVKTNGALNDYWRSLGAAG